MLAAYAVMLRAPAMGLYHDDGIYAVNAKALAEGSGYKILSLPGEISQTKYPILFPLALSAIWRIAPNFPANVLYLKLLPFAALVLWLWIAGQLLTQQTGRTRLSWGIVLLTAASPSILRYSTILLSETLFAVFAWAGLWMLIRCEQRAATASRLVWASLLCAATYHARTVGFTLIAAGILGLVIRRKFRAAILFGALSGILALPWLIWTWSAAGDIPELYAYYTSASYRDWNVLFGFPASQKLTIVAWNALFLLVAPGQMMGFHAILWPLLVLIGVVVVIGFIAIARRSLGVAHVFVLMYVTTLLLWAWPPERFLLPVYPFLLLYAAVGGEWIVKHTSPPRLRIVFAGTAIVLVAFFGGWGSGTMAKNSLKSGRSCRGKPCETSWEDFLSVMLWIQENTPSEAILMGTQDPMLYLYTGRRAVRAFEQDPAILYYQADSDREPFGPPERLAERIAQTGADYLILTRREESLEDEFLWQQFLDLEQQNPALLETEMIVGSPDFGVYRIDRDAL